MNTSFFVFTTIPYKPLHLLPGLSNMTSIFFLVHIIRHSNSPVMDPSLIYLPGNFASLLYFKHLIYISWLTRCCIPEQVSHLFVPWLICYSSLDLIWSYLLYFSNSDFLGVLFSLFFPAMTPSQPSHESWNITSLHRLPWALGITSPFPALYIWDLFYFLDKMSVSISFTKITQYSVMLATY